jgi:hypothetical protein
VLRAHADVRASVLALESRAKSLSLSNDAFALRLSPGFFVLGLSGSVPAAEGLGLSVCLGPHRLDSSSARWEGSERPGALAARLSWNEFPGFSLLIAADVSSSGGLVLSFDFSNSTGLPVEEWDVGFSFESGFRALVCGAERVDFSSLPPAGPVPLSRAYQSSFAFESPDRLLCVERLPGAGVLNFFLADGFGRG